MNLFSDIRSLVLDSLRHMQVQGDLPDGLDFDSVTVEPPRDLAHGDMATNAAMVLAKPAQSQPRYIAEKLVALLTADTRVENVDVAGPGFLNLRLAPTVWSGVLRTILENPSGYGRA